MDLINPLRWVAGDAEHDAVRRLVAYMKGYAGRFFEPIAELSDPNAFEAADIVAVSCLGVTVPAELSAWLLVGEGARACGELLEGICPGDRHASLEQHDLADNQSALALWDLLIGHIGMGPTKVSKLMAAKRPALVPIYDDYVGQALLPNGSASRWRWWQPWQDLLRGDTGLELVECAEHVRARASEEVDVADLSTLRIIDIVVWMSEKEHRWQRLGSEERIS